MNPAEILKLLRATGASEAEIRRATAYAAAKARHQVAVGVAAVAEGALNGEAWVDTYVELTRRDVQAAARARAVADMASNARNGPATPRSAQVDVEPLPKPRRPPEPFPPNRLRLSIPMQPLLQPLTPTALADRIAGVRLFPDGTVLLFVIDPGLKPEQIGAIEHSADERLAIAYVGAAAGEALRTVEQPA